MNQIKITIFIFFGLSIVFFSSCKKSANLNSQMEEVFYIRNGGSDMPVWVHGNGNSKVLLIMLHGGPGDYNLIYRSFSAYEALENKYALVYWDQRHQGNSHGHLKEKDVTVDLMVEDLQLLIRTLKKRYGEDNSIFLMGHSWGGKLGTAFLSKEDYQSDIKGWINIDGALDARTEGISIIEMVNSIGQDELDAGNNPTFWNEFIEYANKIDTNDLTYEKYISLNQRSHQTEAYLAQLADTKNNYSNIDITPHNNLNATITRIQLQSFFLENEYFLANQIPHLEKIEIPSLLIWGKYDFVVPPQIGQITFQGINSNDKELKIYESSAHSPMIYEPERFAMDVSTFVDAHK